MNEWIARRDVAINVAREAGAFARERFLNRSALRVESKGAQDWVSEADRDTETLIRAKLLAAFPNDGFLGEEHGGTTSGSMWIVDPIDGTINFLHGVRYWCISIAFWDGSRPVVGVIYDPMADECFHAALGTGAFVNDSRIAVAQCDSLDTALVCHGYVPRHGLAQHMRERSAIYEAGAAIKDMGAGALMLAHLAAGRYDAYYEPHMHPWDALAGLCLIKEAGGRTLAYPANANDVRAGGRVIASVPGLYDAVAAVVAA